MEQQFSGLRRGDVSLQVFELPGRKSRYIAVKEGNRLTAVARLTGIAGEEKFLRAFRYIALGEEGDT